MKEPSELKKRLFGQWILSVDLVTSKAILSCFYRGTHYIEAFDDVARIAVPWTMRGVRRIAN